MNGNMTNTRKVSTRELQHNLSNYLEIARHKPIIITKYGREKAIMVNPDEFKIIKLKSKKKKAKNIMSSPFIGFYKNRKDWQNKSSVEIGNEIRVKAWYGR